MVCSGASIVIVLLDICIDSSSARTTPGKTMEKIKINIKNNNTKFL
jgi:hypothetical protein